MPEPAWKGRIGQARPRIRTEWNSKLRAGGGCLCHTADRVLSFNSFLS